MEKRNKNQIKTRNGKTMTSLNHSRKKLVTRRYTSAFLNQDTPYVPIQLLQQLYYYQIIAWENKKDNGNWVDIKCMRQRVMDLIV